ncbi:hypothetical protein [uncultured Tenacibaculum sp.]|uniref:hypothetical protein n=1 Tax=uncultured Tenacibaculum sp. TaxID=174713 RepID=UPI00261BB707|nr:hypothetical protein [uncultured Tenacibaculum sp.]
MFKKHLLLISLFLLFSCIKDDDPSEIDIKNTSFSVDENLASGTEIGNIEASTNDGNLTFQLINQTPSNAVTFNQSGALIVNDQSLFNFEVNPVINLEIEVKSESLTKTFPITINLNDVDGIVPLLSTSKQKYTEAANNDWIEITESEFNAIKNKLGEVSVVATTDEQYDQMDFPLPPPPDAKTFVNNNGVDIPAENYLIAVKFFSVGTNVTGTKVKVSSENIRTGYTDLGSDLPEFNGEDVFFVIKNNELKFNNESYLAIYDSQGIIGNYDFGVLTNYTRFSETNNFDPQVASGYYPYQGLSTKKLQW